jgi:hypothetical protein
MKNLTDKNFCKRKTRQYEKQSRQSFKEGLKKEYYEILEHAIDVYGCKDLEDAKWKRLGGQTEEDFINQEYELRLIKLGLIN